MLRGIETAKSGMLSALELNDSVANNLANINTTGFKRTELIFKNIQNAAVKNIQSEYFVNGDNSKPGTISLGSSVDAAIIDFKQGGIKSTGNNFDLALKGDGFFKVEQEGGEVAYTRNGTFTLQPDGALTTLDGKPVLGDAGPIVINLQEAKASEITITADGSIQVKEEEAGKVAVVDFEDKINMVSLGNSFFKPINPDENPEIDAHAVVVQGALESSNANVIESMVNSIAASRTYETLNSIVRTNSETLKKNVTEVGQIRR